MKLIKANSSPGVIDKIGIKYEHYDNSDNPNDDNCNDDDYNFSYESQVLDNRTTPKVTWTHMEQVPKSDVDHIMEHFENRFSRTSIRKSIFDEVIDLDDYS